MSTSPSQNAALSTPRPSVIQLAIKEKAALYAAYIPMFAEGGIFIPSARDHKLGDDVYVLITLPDDPQRYPVAGKVAWITPARATGNRTQGGHPLSERREVGAAQGQDRADSRLRAGLGPADADHLTPGQRLAERGSRRQRACMGGASIESSHFSASAPTGSAAWPCACSPIPTAI